MKHQLNRSAMRTERGFVLFLSALTGTIFPWIVNAEPPALPPEAAPVEKLREDTKTTAAEPYQWGPSIAPPHCCLSNSLDSSRAFPDR
jgi:hypothetical protein